MPKIKFEYATDSESQTDFNREHRSMKPLNSSVQRVVSTASLMAATMIALPFAGCIESSEQDSMVGDRSTIESSEQIGAAKTAAARASSTSAAPNSSSTETGVSEKLAAEKSASEGATPTVDALKNFEDGIAAYQENNLPLAFQEFQAGAKKGHSDSQYNLGLMYEKGIGVQGDETKAVAWYAKSASQGNSAAQFNLGVLHENGRGTKVDFAQANKWYRSASLQGDPLAIGNLGMLYIRGDGVPVNKVAGVALLFMSATIDPSQDNHARRNITSTRGLSAEMIAAAQQLAGELSTSGNMMLSLDQFLEQSDREQ